MENLEKSQSGTIVEREKNWNIVKKYIKDLGLSIDDLRDKKILDVVSGSA